MGPILPPIQPSPEYVLGNVSCVPLPVDDRPYDPEVLIR